MAKAPDSKPPFWTSLPGILTAIGGVIVALTGLITAMLSNGVFSSKEKPTTAPTSNIAVSLASTPAPLPSPQLPKEDLQYKQMAGVWEVIEEQPEEVGSNKITWQYQASVSGNEFSLRGRVTAFNGQTDLPPDKKGTTATTVLTIKDSMGIGKLRQKDHRGVVIESPASIVLGDDLLSFTGTLIVSGHKCILTGHKEL